MDTNKRYAIIGGGAAGCTLAWHLTRNGHEVHVYEKWKGLGGLAAGIPFGHTVLDRFYHHIFTSDTHVRAYAERLGLGEKLKWCESSVGFEHEGKLYPFTTPLDLLRFKPLSFLSRFRTGLAVLNMRRMSDYHKLEHITAEEFIIRQMGEQAYRVLWEPLLRSKFGDRYREVSAVWFWGKIKLRGGTRSEKGTGESLGYMKDGWAQIYERLGEQIEEQGGVLRLGQLVRNIRKEPNGKLSVHTRDSVEQYDRVLFTPSVPMLLKPCRTCQRIIRHRLTRSPIRQISQWYWCGKVDFTLLLVSRRIRSLFRGGDRAHQPVQRPELWRADPCLSHAI